METSHPKPEPETPADFPRGGPMGALPGAQPKFLARKIDGKYVVGLTAEELYARYDACSDLVNQLVDYCKRKQQEHPEWTNGFLFNKVATGVRERKDLELTREELIWIFRNLCHRMAWSDFGDK